MTTTTTSGEARGSKTTEPQVQTGASAKSGAPSTGSDQAAVNRTFSAETLASQLDSTLGATLQELAGR